MKSEISKLVYYHSNPEYHRGGESGNIIIAAFLLTNKNLEYDDYLKECAYYNIENYNEKVFNEYKEGIKYVY